MQAMQGIQSFEQVMILVVLATAFVALGYAYWLARQTFAADKGTESMQRVWGFIRDGANAYLRTQLRTIAILIAVLTVAMFLSVALVRPTGEANELFCRAEVETAYAGAISTMGTEDVADDIPLEQVTAALEAGGKTAKQ